MIQELTLADLGRKETVNYLIERDGLKCQIYFCKDPYRFTEKNFLTVDHVVPKSKGGSDHVSNLVIAHMRCNTIKGDRLYLPDGTLEPLPYKEPKSNVKKRPPCETCNEGRDLDRDESCPICGLGPMPAKFPRWSQLSTRDCPHAGVWHCWGCTIGIYDRVPASEDVFGKETV